MQVYTKSMEEQGKINQRLLEEQQGVKEEQKVIKSQLTKLTSLLTVQEQGHFPSQPQPNPRGQHMAETSNPGKQHVKEAIVIITRSGMEIDGPTPPSNLIPNTTSNKDDAPKDQEAPSDSMPVPFPQALLKPRERNSALQGEILEQLKQVRINLPLLHVIKQVPNYAKVIKDLCTLKRKHNVKKTAFLAEQASAVIDSKTPPKYKDPGCLTVACQIGNQACGQALLDLGASVNLMPYSVYLQLGLGEIKPTTVVLQLADRSVRKPRGIVEDVLVQIDKFYYPVDFLVLDTIAIVNTESKISLILGRPFLATANALINCRNGLMTLSFGNMTLEVNVFRVSRQPHEEDECFDTYMINELILEDEYIKVDSNPLDLLLDDFDIDDSYSHAVNVVNVFDKSQGFVKKSWQPCFEELPKEREPPKPSSEEVPTPTLAPLPKGLKHAFLGQVISFRLLFLPNLVMYKEINC
ncbi:hypothetical protein UlMin_015942 [Ulmus minor]